jgi:methionyl-tRNA formyltransferase
MKQIIYCLQNKVIESILVKANILTNESIIIRSPRELLELDLKKIKPSFIMFPHWSHIVPAKITNNYDCVCFHSTPLPYGRGGSPLQNMILAGHSETELCSLKMTGKLDEGPVYLRSKVSLKGKMSEILDRVYNEIANQIRILLSEEVKPKPQKGKITYFKRLKKSDNFLDLSREITDIYDSIRMVDSDLYPDAQIILGNKKIIFYDAEISENSLIAKVKINDKD